MEIPSSIIETIFLSKTKSLSDQASRPSYKATKNTEDRRICQMTSWGCNEQNPDRVCNGVN